MGARLMGIRKRLSSGERESMILCLVRKGLRVRQCGSAAALFGIRMRTTTQLLTSWNQLEDGKACHWV